MALRWVVVLLLVVIDADRVSAVAPETFDAVAGPFLRSYCNRCHDAKVQEGDFRLDTLSSDFTIQEEAERWSEVRFRIHSGEMPPKSETQPKPEELAKVTDWISARLVEGEAARLAKRGPIAHYRLSREEYANTVQDLLGVHYDPVVPGALNEDPRWHGFERIGSMLSLSPSHIERYLKAADEVVASAFPAEATPAKQSIYDPTKGNERWLAEQGLKGPVRTLLWPNRQVGVARLGAGAIVIDKPGTYRMRVKLSGMRPRGGRAPHLTIWNVQLRTSVYDADILAPEEAPITLEWTQPFSAGMYALWNNMPGFDEKNTAHFGLTHRLNFFTNSREVGHLNPTGYKLFDDQREAIYPLLIVDSVDWEGPLVSEEVKRRRKEAWPKSLAVSPPPLPKVRTKPVVPPPPPPPLDIPEARVSLERFASRAWRRPATAAEIDRYVKVLESELAVGETSASAYRSALVGILTSKSFFYLEEGSADERREQVNDWELASRLSYLLWGSMPDDALFAAAAAGTIRDPQVLRTQLARMFSDEKIERFTDAFPQQWLQLHRVGEFAPDPQLYPEYDAWLERSMVLETKAYFKTMLLENRSLREFLISDWTIANERLTRHYGLPTTAEQGQGFQKVKLRPEDHRGGLLTQAAILSLSSDGSRHRPVHRGVWVSEAIFGRTPPPPPPNVEPLEPTPLNEPKATIRRQLEAHATNAVCASCHRTIDPLGFAFDHFDAVGVWRTEERVDGGKGDNPPVNASGVLPDGRPFSGAEEFKMLLAADLDRFAEAFVSQLATFALRRVMTVDDAPRIKAIAAATKADGYPLRGIVEAFVTSDLFLQR